MMAQPMRCVNDTLPPRVRRMWLLMTILLSIMSFAGTVRTLVAVGIDRLMSMFLDTVRATPRSGVTFGSSDAVASVSTGAFLRASAGIGAFFGWRAVVFASTVPV